MKEKINKIKEQLADIEHQKWSHWQKYLHSKCVEHSDGKGEWVCFPSELFRHWERQINTPYSELTEKEKDSDREQVERYLYLIEQTYKQAYEKGFIDGSELTGRMAEEEIAELKEEMKKSGKIIYDKNY
jgi:hypothetical protein